jgi:hypothetical protein
MNNRFVVVCATQLESKGGMQFWGVTEAGRLVSARQRLTNGPWIWEDDWAGPGTPATNIKALTAAPARNGYMSLWACTADGVLHCKSQTSFTAWGEWSNPDTGWWPNPKSPKLTRIMCAGLMGWKDPAMGDPKWPKRGRAFWGVGEDGNLWVTYEDLDGSGWVPWYVWNDKNTPGQMPNPENITALTTAVAGKDSSGSLMSLWVLTKDNVLHCISQRSDGGKNPYWDPWVRRWWEAPDLVSICASRLGG